MKCPLLTAGNLERFPPENEEFLNCLKEECAWWDKKHKVCAIVVIAGSLKGILGANMAKGGRNG